MVLWVLCGRGLKLVLLIPVPLFLASFLHLLVVDFLINSIICEQLVVRADRLHRAAVKDNDLVGLLHGGNTLRDDDLGGVRDFLCECPSDKRIGLGIDRARRVIG